MVSKERWLKGQALEREWHDEHNKQGADYYKTYLQYFRYTGVDRERVDSIIEVGPADHPALSYCNQLSSFVIEPLPSDTLKHVCRNHGIILIASPAEETEWPKADETWLFNVLQHVLDPDVIINKAKEATNVIRFFEPINLPIDAMHFHSFTLDYYKKHFGGCTTFYPKNKNADNFHTWECAYGKWEKDN